jgi:hypothetical protein
VPPGVYIDCDIQSLIEEVVISPLTPSYSCEALETSMKALAPFIPIRRSTLLSKAEDLTWERFSPELRLLWDHYRRTHRVLDVDEISLSEEALEARRSQMFRTSGNGPGSATGGPITKGS